MVADFSVVLCDRMSSNGYKLKHQKIHLNKRRNLFPWKVAEHWNRLPREVLGSPSLEIFQTHLDIFLCHLLKVTLPGQRGWTGCSQRSLPTLTFPWFCVCNQVSLRKIVREKHPQRFQVGNHLGQRVIGVLG